MSQAVQRAWNGITWLQRAQFVVGMVCAVAAAVQTVDVMYLRPEEYKERWDERDDMLRARHLELLMLGKTDGYWDQLRYGFLERATAPAQDAAPTGITARGAADKKAHPSLMAVGERSCLGKLSSVAVPGVVVVEGGQGGAQRQGG
ncbi:hypothetical protein QJQ45_018976 [Haematococcus lacustris]|nr:hypothetical protein QJQ45_018976 [Haematococcus lacustris]